MTSDLWKYLQQADKPIVMYGMGNGADKILSVCADKGIEVADFFASDGFVRGHSFHGKRVLSYSEAKEKYGGGNFIVLLSFASSLPSVIETIQNVANETELYAPDVPVHGAELFDSNFCEARKGELSAARELFCDEHSKLVYDSVISYKLSGKIDYLLNCNTTPDEAYNELLRAENFEYTADLGAYNGDTARELSRFAPSLKRIYTFEPDRRNFRKLSEYASAEERFEVLPFNLAAWSKEETLSFGAEGNRNSGVGDKSANQKTAKLTEVKANSLDNIIFKNMPPRLDYIKYDVEGAEAEAIKGSAECIRRFSPSLLVSLYHRSEDIFSLPLTIAEEFPNYDLYLRKFRYIPAWDLNLYAIPKK
ncbi:MAG: FkbM family methyltransferase [Ruminococcaceae bacterium]|nr:FkbM family methyltransferase [Oscillospiraceae bacterium]